MGKSKAKYERWILKERRLAPKSNINLGDSKGNILRSIYNIYECPYCHKTYECKMVAKPSALKCRFCNHNVSPYDGNPEMEIWLPAGAECFILIKRIP